MGLHLHANCKIASSRMVDQSILKKLTANISPCFVKIHLPQKLNAGRRSFLDELQRLFAARLARSVGGCRAHRFVLVGIRVFRRRAVRGAGT